MNAKWIGPAFAVLLAAAWGGRNVQVPLQPPARTARVMEPSRLAPQQNLEEEFWTAVAGADRDEVLRRTPDFLRLSPEEGRAFHSAAVGAIEDVDRAWAIRENGWIAIESSAASDPELLERLEGEIQSRYESAKDRALRPVIARLQGSERGDRLRERLDEWFDAVR